MIFVHKVLWRFILQRCIYVLSYSRNTHINSSIVITFSRRTFCHEWKKCLYTFNVKYSLCTINIFSWLKLALQKLRFDLSKTNIYTVFARIFSFEFLLHFFCQFSPIWILYLGRYAIHVSTVSINFHYLKGHSLRPRMLVNLVNLKKI